MCITTDFSNSETDFPHKQDLQELDTEEQAFSGPSDGVDSALGNDGSVDEFNPARLTWYGYFSGHYGGPSQLDSPRPVIERDPKILPIAPGFPRFMELPPEVRERIYAFAMTSNKSIRPQLCDKAPNDFSQDIKFHDLNQENHNEIYRLSRVTEVSKEIRSEALPVFYSTNTFEVESDTITYFERLEYLNRFRMIRHVNFAVDFRPNAYAARALRDMNQYNKSASAYEKEVVEDAQESGEKDINEKHYARSFDTLIDHPQYAAGGIYEVGIFLVLRKLTSVFTRPKDNVSAGTEYTHKLVLHVPDKDMFNRYPKLQWFVQTAKGLGIHLELVGNAPIYFWHTGFRILWDQKFQKKSFEPAEDASRVNVSTNDVKNAKDTDFVLKKALEMFPNLENMARPAKNCYYRRKCRSEGITWFDVETEAGGVVEGDDE